MSNWSNEYPDVYWLAKSHDSVRSHFGDITKLLLNILWVWMVPPDHFPLNQ